MRLLSLAALLAPALVAQNFTGQIKLKPLVPPLSQPWNTKQAAAAKLPGTVPANTGTCSVPLLTVTPGPVDRHMTVTPPEGKFAVRTVTPPAPPCDIAARR